MRGGHIPSYTSIATRAVTETIIRIRRPQAVLNSSAVRPEWYLSRMVLLWQIHLEN